MDAAAEKARELLPCYHERWCDTPGMKIIALCESCKRRPAVAAALRERDEWWYAAKRRIADLEKQLKNAADSMLSSRYVRSIP